MVKKADSEDTAVNMESICKVKTLLGIEGLLDVQTGIEIGTSTNT